MPPWRRLPTAGCRQRELPLRNGIATGEFLGYLDRGLHGEQELGRPRYLRLDRGDDRRVRMSAEHRHIRGVEVEVGEPVDVGEAGPCPRSMKTGWSLSEAIHAIGVRLGMCARARSIMTSVRGRACRKRVSSRARSSPILDRSRTPSAVIPGCQSVQVSGRSWPAVKASGTTVTEVSGSGSPARLVSR